MTIMKNPQNRNDECNCGSRKKYKKCCGKPYYENSDKTKSDSEPEMNYKENIPVSELMKSLKKFIQDETIDFSLYLMGETDFTYTNITHQCVENWYNNFHQSIGMDYYTLIQYLGSHLDENRYEHQIVNNIVKRTIFFLYALSYFLQSDTYQNFKSILPNRTVIITFFKNKKGYYYPHIIGMSLDHPSSPLFLCNAYRMIKLCVSRRKHLYDSLAVDVIINSNY